ncbi:MAG TPA: TetR family transcriptional regulator [Acidimicrobiia bacterium]|nr:TetR family transcriptional regulator [Acidimicrobiia bacterium]
MTDWRRQQILEAAGRVIAVRGLCETRVADIADELRVSPGLILFRIQSFRRPASGGITSG